MRTWEFNASNEFNTVEIDLRKEFIDILYGKNGEAPRGHWIIYRQSDLSRRSQYWNEEKQEAIGGPPFEYKDYLIRGRYNTYTSGNNEQTRDYQGIVDRPLLKYYLDYRIHPKKEDYIIEIKNDYSFNPPSEFIVTNMYDILLVDKPKDLFGRVEYYMCICERHISSGDTTLSNIQIEDIL